MRKSAAIVMTTCVLVVALASCDRDGEAPSATPGPTASTTKAPNVSEHESGPESPIAYGLQVPRGASQLGPLVRYRSPQLIAAYQPELDAAVAQKVAEDHDKAAEAEREGTPIPSTVPTPDPRPSDDTFDLLEEPPHPDTTISLMRIDGKPSDVVRRMLAQIAAALPEVEVDTSDLSKYCAAVEQRITGCRFVARGLTHKARDLRITMTVDPGNVKTRTSPPSTLTRPVMTLTVEYVGEPRKGQLGRETNDLGDVDPVDSDEISGLIWPKMDVDAPGTTKLVNGWVAPKAATILLSGFSPKFVTLTTSRAADADLIAEQFAASNGAKGAYTKDVVEDLNEVITSYTATAKDGSIARGIYVLSARGNYTTLFYYPAAK